MEKLQLHSKFLTKFFVYAFFASIIFENSIWMLYLRSLDYSFSMIAIIQITLSISLMFFEYLSGILADKFGRKKMLLIANLLICLYAVLMIFANFIAVVFIAYILYAFALALISGTDQSLVYDNLTKSQKKNFMKISSIMQGIAISAAFVGEITGGQLVQVLSWEWIFIFTCVTHIISFLFLLFFIKDKYQTEIQKQDKKDTRIYANLKKEFGFKQELWLLILVFAFVQGSVSIVFNYGQAIYSDKFLLDESMVSIIFGVTSFAVAFILILFSFIKKINWHFLIFGLMIVSFILSFFFKTNNLGFFITIFAFLYVTLSFVFTHLMNIVNDIIMKFVRASVISLMNFASSITMITFQILLILYNSFEVLNEAIYIFLIISFAIAVLAYGFYLFKFKKTVPSKITEIEKKISKLSLVEDPPPKTTKKIEHLKDYLVYLNNELLLDLEEENS